MAQREYEFTLTLTGIDGVTPDVANALYDSGCDDALFGVRDGVAFAEFTREARSFKDAVLSAIRDVERAKVGAKVVRIEPDEFVTISEIARRLNRCREGVRKLVAGSRGPGGFPAPIANLSQKSPFWRWTDVINWCLNVAHLAPVAGQRATGKKKRLKPSLDSNAIVAAAEVAALNAALDLRRYATPEMVQELYRRVVSRR